MSKPKLVLLIIVAIIALAIIIEVVNASKYKMLVNVVAEEGVMGVNPLGDKLDFGDLSRNNGATRVVTLQSGGRFSTYIVVWKYGSISPLVKLNNNFFTLAPGEEFKLTFELKVPPSAEVKKYSGRAWIFRIPKFW